MALTRIQLGPSATHRCGAARVYFRTKWSGEWQLQSHVEVDELTWSCAPSLPTAVMTWHYGLIGRPGAAGLGRVFRKSGIHRYYVKIVADVEYSLAGGWQSVEWYGIIDLVQDRVDGAVYSVGLAPTVIARGEQKIIAYGLERMLQEQFVTTSWWREGNGGPLEIERGLTFNERGLANRHTTRWVWKSYLFAGKREEATFWSTRDAVEYLLRYQTPKNFNGIHVPRFRLADGHELRLPDWDKPQLPTHAQRTYDLLEQLIPRQRLLGWFCTVVNNEVLVNLYTYTATKVNLGIAGRSIVANTNQLHLVPDFDRTAEVDLKESTVGAYDQVIVQGARRRSCWTICFDDGSLDRGWSDGLQEIYNAGASEAGDYPASAEVKERQQRNAEARAADLVRPVFRKFVITSDWNRRAAAGVTEGVYYTPGGGAAVFPVAADDAGFPVFRLEMELEPTLPLLIGVDYSVDKIEKQTFNELNASLGKHEMPPLVAWKLPLASAERYCNIEHLGKMAELERIEDLEKHTWSASVRVLDHEPAFELNVIGDPQHVLAKDDFDPLPEDEKIGPLSDHDWREMFVTVSMLDDRYVEGRYPTALDPMIDAPRILVIDAGDGYKQDFVARGTIVGIEGTTGQLQRSTGGYVRNDTQLLVSAARVAFEFYGPIRRVLTITSELTEYLRQLSLGQYVVKIGEDVDQNVPPLAVNSPITELKLVIPRGTPENTPPQQWSLTTGAGELDAVQLLPAGGKREQELAGPIVSHPSQNQPRV